VNVRGLAARTRSAAATRALAAEVAQVVAAGDIVLLAGELGTGKTVWVQGFSRGLGVTEQVTSPTFTLVRPYQGTTLQLLHADVYRLDHLSEVVDLGLVEQLDDRPRGSLSRSGQGPRSGRRSGPDTRSDGRSGPDTRSDGRSGPGATGTVACIEWGDLAAPVLPADFLEVHLAYGDDDDERLLRLRPVGSRWGDRLEPLRAALSPWLDGQ
jgi:tRNA threonylcarbamoyl adenosine modification protein YjeE